MPTVVSFDLYFHCKLPMTKLTFLRFLFSYLVAIGTESGEICLYKWSLSFGWKNITTNDKTYPLWPEKELV